MAAKLALVMPYTVCSNCGQKALKVATRCPKCGVAFEEQFFSHSAPPPTSRRRSLSLLIIGVAAVLLLANALLQRFAITPPPAPVAISPSRPAADPPAVRPHPHESTATVTTPPAPAPEEGAEAARTPEPPAPEPAPTLAAVGPSVAVAPVGMPPGERRYASTWMNVRSVRSNTASVLRILRPGEAVMVDSLLQGWYRVSADGQPIGYVDRRLLDTVPPLP